MTDFITSYSHCAIKVIRFTALDYLVKPIDLGELKQAIKWYKDSFRKTLQLENLKLALQNMDTKNVAEHKLVLQTQEGELRLVLKEIIRIEGERNYSYIYLKNGKKKLVTKTLADLEDLLNEKVFYQMAQRYPYQGEKKMVLIVGFKFIKVEINKRRRRKINW